MKTIILVRHGESETNLTKAFTGQLDINLTEVGREQARRMAEYLDLYKIDVVYSSTLKRAFDTAQAIVKRQKCPIIEESAFCEINAGKWHGMKFDDISSTYPDTYKEWKENIGKAHPDGGESCQELYNRVTSHFESIINESVEETIAIVSHATPIRMIESYISARCVDVAQDISWVPNASVTIYNYNDNFHPINRGYCEYLGELTTNLPKNI